VLNLSGVLNAEKRYARMMLIVLLAQVAHAGLLITYDGWAPFFG
jgi:hypothetical protein